MGDLSPKGGVARRVPLPDGTYTRPDVVAKVVEPKPASRPQVNTQVQTKSGAKGGREK